MRRSCSRVFRQSLAPCSCRVVLARMEETFGRLPNKWKDVWNNVKSNIVGTQGEQIKYRSGLTDSEPGGLVDPGDMYVDDIYVFEKKDRF